MKRSINLCFLVFLFNFNFNLFTKEIFSTIPNNTQITALSTNSNNFTSTNFITNPPIKWSILISTLESRRASFEIIFKQLQNQIQAAGLQDQIEIVVYRDDRELPVGAKRNVLLETARGAYVSAVDDDDLVADCYITKIYAQLLQNPDCVSLEGIMTFCEGNPTKFIHATKYTKYINTPELILRPLTHLDVIKASIAKQFRFPDTKNWQEDQDWALQISAAGVLKTEIHIDSEPLYFYKFDPYQSETFNQDDFAAANLARATQKNYLARKTLNNPKINNNKPKILFKLPTRERAHKIFKLLDLYYSYLSHQLPYEFVLSCDLDDLSMNNPAVITKLKTYPNLTVHFGPRVNKIEAVNRDLAQHLDFDILIVISDDMTPVVKNYDLRIANLLLEKFPDLDGTLNLFDGHTGPELNTLPIMGKKYYQRFNYIYYPEYQSICCDLEFTLVARLLQRELYSNQLLIRHDFAGYNTNTGPNPGIQDNLYQHNQAKTYFEHDKNILQSRKATNFDLTNPEIKLEQLPTSLDLFGPVPAEVTWSILIPTINCRTEKFTKLYLELLKQIQKYHLEAKVEILFYRDNQEQAVGYKRNRLLAESRGQYISFIDDDDLIHTDYIKLIYRKLLTKPDCVSLTGIITFNGQNPCKFIHSIKYNSWFTDYDGENPVYYRPPNHLNPIKRTIASQFKFPVKNIGEDADWSMQISKSSLIKTEAEINEPYYFYRFDTTNSVQTRIKPTCLQDH